MATSLAGARKSDHPVHAWLRGPQGAAVLSGLGIVFVFVCAATLLASLLFPIERVLLGFFTFFCMITFLGIPFAAAIVVDAADHAES
jgi:hypothetical protein